jgi:hypothetical protein
LLNREGRSRRWAQSSCSGGERSIFGRLAVSHANSLRLGRHSEEKVVLLYVQCLLVRKGRYVPYVQLVVGVLTRRRGGGDDEDSADGLSQIKSCDGKRNQADETPPSISQYLCNR